MRAFARRGLHTVPLYLYALVPVEPTEAMLDAAGMSIVPDDNEWLDQSNREVWASMLAAARKGNDNE